VSTPLQLSLSIVFAMLCVLVAGNIIINRYQTPASALREHTAPPVETKKTSPNIVKKFNYDQIIEDVARTYGLDSALLYAVISVESGSNPKTVSKKGATGLMQLMPSTARYYGVVDLLDPVQNLHAGAKYLRDMLILFNNDVSLAVAAYNAGETAVVRYGNHIPPYRETMNYVPRVLKSYRQYQRNRPRPSDVLTVAG
jgi:soluble lytic murein transglycosylase-like protein